MNPPPFKRSSTISALLVELAVELADELLHAERFHVRHVDVADLAARELVDELAVVLDPRLLAQ